MPLIIFLASCISSLIFALSFPPFNFWYFAFFGLVPLIFLSSKYNKLSFFIGFIAGLSFYIFLLNWLFAVSGFFYILLCVYLAIYWGIFFYLSSLYNFNPFVCASMWFFIEILIENLLTGFPWLSFSLSQSTNHYIWKLPQIIGSKGISFFLILSNFTIFCLFQKKFKVFLISFFVFIISFTLLFFYNPEIKQKGKLKVMIIQPGIKTEKIKESETIINILWEMTTKNVKKLKPDVVIWPEGSFPDDIFSRPEILKKIKLLCENYKFSLIFGTFRSNNSKYYNSALFLKNGKIEFYDKTHLVPYGEFILGGRWEFIKKIFVNYAGYTPNIERGKEIKNFNYKEIKIAPLICYENIFPEITNKMLESGSNIFVVITNDSWFGNSFGPYQHFYHNVLRALETGRYFIQCGLSGISGIISEKGEVLKIIDIDKKETLFFEVPLFFQKTIYGKYSDFPISILSLLIIGGYLCRILKK